MAANTQSLLSRIDPVVRHETFTPQQWQNLLRYVEKKPPHRLIRVLID